MRTRGLAVTSALLAVVTLGVLGAGCESGSARPAPKPEKQEPPPAARTAGPDLVSAQASYTRLCAPCHADDGTGYRADFAPSLVNPTFLESATDEFLQRSIVFGRPGTSMGAYGKALGGPLDDTAVTGLVAWIRAKGPQARPLAPVGKGTAARGAETYQKYCLSCHGDAKARGEAPHLANLQFLTVASDAFIKHAIVQGRPKTKMLAFGTVMSDADIDDVVAYVRQLGTASTAPTLLPEPTGKEPLVLNPKGGDPQWKPHDEKFIGVDDVAAALKAGKRMIVIDARPPSDWRRVHITGAVSIPYHDMARLSEVPKGVYVVAYCACPHHLSGIVVDELRKRGHERAYVLDEGINIWHQRGYPVIAAEGVTPPPMPAASAPVPPPAGGAPKQPHQH